MAEMLIWVYLDVWICIVFITLMYLFSSRCLLHLKNHMEGVDGEWNQASNMLLQTNRDLLFVGVYDTEGFNPVSLSGSSSARDPRGSDTQALVDDWRITITPRQLRAIYSHIKYGRSLMAMIDIAHLNFACIRNGGRGLAGMSNFNMESREVMEADRLLFSLTNEHYTRQDSLEGIHALNMAAFVEGDFLVVGISKSGKTSVSEAMKDLVLIKDGKLQVDSVNGKNNEAQPGATDKAVDFTVDSKDSLGVEEVTGKPTFVFGELDSDSSDEAEMRTTPQNKPLTEMGRVQMRASTKSEAEKKNDQLKRQTSFCEDWRTATIRSIEALQMMGPFGNGQNDNDTEPLLDDVGVIADDKRDIEKTEAEVPPRTPEARRQSRVTQV